MPSILRWFQHDGVRYRAYFRGLKHGGTADLILASGDWQGCVNCDDVTCLDAFSEDELARLVTRLRSEPMSYSA